MVYIKTNPNQARSQTKLLSKSKNDDDEKAAEEEEQRQPTA